MLIPIFKHNSDNDLFQTLQLHDWMQLMGSGQALAPDNHIADLRNILEIVIHRPLNVMVIDLDFRIDSTETTNIGEDTLMLDTNYKQNSFNLHYIRDFSEVIRLVDSPEENILLIPPERYELLKQLFHKHLLLTESITKEAKAFLTQLNQTHFTDDCPHSACQNNYKAQITLTSEHFILCASIRPSEFIRDRMAMGGADLHIHTTASDSSDTPEEVCHRVLEAGLKTFAITDHDNTEAAISICNCLENLQKKRHTENIPVFIPGTEISVQEERELHLLAYYPFGGFKRLQFFLEKQQQARDKRNFDMISTLQSLGYDISIEELNSSGDHSVGRMQMALLLKARGYVKTTAQAFSDLLGYGRPGYIERPRPSLQEAIYEIRLAGGVPVIAHPALYGWCKTVSSPATKQALITRFTKYKEQGLIGIEAFHGEAETSQQHLLSEVALKLQMLRTGGSDDHGRNKSHTNLFSGDVNFY